MNESEAFINSSIINKCRVCLKSTSELYPMCGNLKKLYKSCVDFISHKEYMKTCAMCRWTLRKFTKFKQQCETANNLLNNIVYMETEDPTLQDISINLKQTNLHTFSIIPCDNKNFINIINYELITENCTLTKNINIYDVQNYNDSLKNENCDNQYDSGDYDFNSGDNHFNSGNNHFNSGNNDFNSGNNDFNSGDNDIDNDEIPLILLKSDKKKKKRIKNEVTNEIIKIKPEKNTISKKKVLKEGFSSRMVQETDEYIVIKLTKEQVLKEMEERSKSDSYLRSPFKCDKCVKGFNFDDVLQTHMEKHTMKNGNFQCDMCNQYCPNAVSLRGHIKSHTTRYKCKLCGHTRLSRQHLLEHYSISHTNTHASYNCHFCNFTTNKRTIMQRHVRRHESRESHACHKCGKLFKSIESLRLHTVRHDKSSRFKCTQCDASFMYTSLLRRHEQCVHVRREYYCVECDVQFISSESLRLHFKKAKKHRDSSANKHACPQCACTFFTLASLSVHLTTTHDSPRTHACVSCSRTYSSKDALRAHSWRTHGRRKCTDCGDYHRKNATKTSCGQNTLENEKKDAIQYENKIEE